MCRDLLASSFLGVDLLVIILAAIGILTVVVAYLDSHDLKKVLPVRFESFELPCQLPTVWAFVSWLFTWGEIGNLLLKIRIMRLKGLYLRYRVRKALLKIDILLLKRDELISRKGQSLSQNGSGPVLVDQLLDSCERVETHISSLANDEAWHPLPGAPLRFRLKFLATLRL